MTTLICDFQSIVGEKIEGYATLTAGKVRPSYSSPAVVVHEPIKQAVTDGQTTFENVNPGDAVITVEWADQTQSATIRFVVPDSDEAIYLADCLSADSLDPDEIELLRWGIRENLSGARELLETAKNLGLTEINGTVEAYFTEAAEILRKALEAAQLAKQSLDTIDTKVEATEGVVTDVDQAKGQIQDLLGELATLEQELGETNTDLAGAVGTINALSPQVSAATQAASAATQKAQNAVNELNNVQDANAAEFITIKQDLNSAVQTAKQATDAVAQNNQQLNNEVQRILGEVDTALSIANEATAQARINNENLETYQYQLGEISQEQGRILGQQAEIVGSYDHQIAELERLSAEISSANSELDTISGEQSALVTEMNTQVGSLHELTALQGAAINAAKSQADKGVSDAAAASNALSSYKKVNDPRVVAAQSTADTARAEATSKANAARLAAEEVAKELADKAQADAEVAAATEALRIAQEEATAAKNAASADATAKANAARVAAENLAKAQAKAAQEAAELTAAQDASEKANKAKADAEAKAATLANAAEQAAATALTGYKNLNDPKVTKAQSDATKGINAAAAAKSAADQAALDATNKSKAAREAAEDYAREAAEAAQAQAEEHAAAEALRVAQMEAAAAKASAATDAKAKADEAERLAKLYAEAQAKTAKEQAEKTAAQDAATKAENARIAAEANAKVLSDKAQQAAVAAQSSIDNLEIGGRNLFSTSMYAHHTNVAHRPSVGTSAVVEIEPNTTYTVSIRNKQTNRFGIWQDPLPDGIRAARESNDHPLTSPAYIPTTPGQDIVSTFTTLGEEAGRYITIYLSNEGGDQHMDKIMVERGNKATDWTPAPEDVATDIAKAQTEAETARAEAVSKSDAARVAAELYAKEQAEAAQADAEVEAARAALEIAQREAQAAKDAAATDATQKANAARTAAENLAKAEAKAAKEAAEATAAADASTKANKAKTDAEAKAAQLASAAQDAADKALTTYKGQNDPKVSKAQQDATKGINNAATALAKANEANNKLPSITADVSAAAQTALEAVNALPGIRTDISVAKKQADKGVQDAATAKSAVDNLQIGGRNLRRNSNSFSNYGTIYGAVRNKIEEGVSVSEWGATDATRMKYTKGTSSMVSTPLISYLSSEVVTFSYWLKNVGTTPIRVRYNGLTPSGTETYEPGFSGRIVHTGKLRNNYDWFQHQFFVDDPDTSSIEFVLWRAKLEAGTVATDWTPAPEDVDAEIATAQSTAEDTALTLSNQALQDATTALTNYQKVNDPKVTAAKNTADTAKSRADQGVSDAATAKSAADTAKQRADKGVNDAATAKQVADQVGADLENLEIGGRNLLLDSKPEVTNTRYPTSSLYFPEGQAPKDGERVTLSLRVDVAESATHISLHNSGGSYGLGSWGTSRLGSDGVFKTTFTWKEFAGSSNTYLNVYILHSGDRQPVTLHWAKLERGNRATDWTPAPEDTQAEINALINKADDLTTGLSNAATQEDYNQLNTRLWGNQGELNKINSLLWEGQNSVNNRQAAWNKAAEEASAALARFAISQSQWNELSATASDANTKAIASHAALFEGQNKWNEVAAAAIQTQADFATKQTEWNAVQKKVNDNFTRWQNAAKEMLDASGKFQALQTQFNSDQKKWNDTQLLVNDKQKGINALNNKTNDAQNDAIAANTTAIKALAKIDTGESLIAYLTPSDAEVKAGTAKYDVPVWTTGAHREFNGNNAPPAQVKYAFGAASNQGTLTARKVPVTVRPGTKYILSFWAYGSGKMVIYLLGNGAGHPVRFTRQLKVNQDTLQIEKDAGGKRVYDPAGNGNSSNTNGTQWLLNGFKPDQLYRWVHYKYEVEFTESTTEVWFQNFYWNWSEQSVYGQYLGGLQFYPDVPTQADVDEAQNKALQALNRFAVNQSEWNKVSADATNALTAGQAAQKELNQKRENWEKGANLAINNLQSTSTKFKQWTNGATLALNNLQTSSAKFKQWTKAASDALAAGELADTAQDNAIAALTEIIGTEGDNGQEGSLTQRISMLETDMPIHVANLRKEVSDNTRMVWHKHQWVLSNNLNIPDKRYFSVTGTLTNFKITAVGNWVGEFMLTAVSSNGGTHMDWREVTATSRDWSINMPSGLTGGWRRAVLDYSITPGEAINLSKKSTSKTALAVGAYRVLWQHTVPVTAPINASLNVGWHAATFDYRYGIRIRAGSGTILAEDGPRTGVGPRTPIGNGYRNMNRSVSNRTVTAGTTIYFEAFVSSGGTDQRTVRDFTANINYIK